VDPSVGVGAAKDQPGHRFCGVQWFASGVEQFGGERPVGLQPGREGSVGAEEAERMTGVAHQELVRAQRADYDPDSEVGHCPVGHVLGER
jgi:hypothetical protein